MNEMSFLAHSKEMCIPHGLQVHCLRAEAKTNVVAQEIFSYIWHRFILPLPPPFRGMDLVADF